MMEDSCWPDGNIKYESHLNFAAANTSEDDDYGYGKKKLSRDPLSHRIIEKRRRDRMNNCLADLSRLIPPDYMKKGRGRVEKTEIIEMAIRHMKHLMTHPCQEGTCFKSEENSNESLARSYRLGYNDCLTETLHFLVDSEGYLATSTLCNQLATHLNQHCDSVLTGDGVKIERECRDNHYFTSSSTGTSHESGSESSHISSANHVSPTSSNSSDKCSSSESKCSSIETGYKFKNSIQRRFESTAPVRLPHPHHLGPTPAVPPSSGLLPGFALSPRGHYYLPICVDPTQIPSEPAEGEVMLHPVTISVNFRPSAPPLPQPSAPPSASCLLPSSHLLNQG